MDNLVRPIPTTFFSFQMAWQISLAAAIWAFSPSRPPTVARRMNETQRRQPTASMALWTALGWDWDTRSRIWDRKAEKCLSSHCAPNVETNTTYAWKRFQKKHTLEQNMWKFTANYPTCLFFKSSHCHN